MSENRNTGSVGGRGGFGKPEPRLGDLGCWGKEESREFREGGREGSGEGGKWWREGGGGGTGGRWGGNEVGAGGRELVE